MRLTERDIALFQHLAKFGSLLTSQIADLFSLHLKITQRRLRKLRQAGWVEYIELPSTRLQKAEYLWYLSKQGADLIGAQFSKTRKTLQLTHRLENAGILIHVLRELYNTEIECLIAPEHIMRQSNLSIIPDGGFILTRNNKAALFLIENDAGSESLVSHSLHDDIESKLISFSRLFEENEIGFYEQYFNKELNRFRLLILTTGLNRADSVSRLIKEHDSHGFIWVALKNRFEDKGILGRIWHIPATDKWDCSIIGGEK